MNGFELLGIAPPGPLPEEVAFGLGTSPSPKPERIPWTRELLALAVQMAVRANGGPVTLHRFVQMAGISDAAVYRLFPGGWGELLETAGMEAAPRSSRKYSDDDLLREYHRLVVTLEKMPTWAEIDRHGRVSSPTLQRRFGRMRDVKRRYRQFLLKQVKARGMSLPARSREPVR